jgi:hypothetical protein
MDKAPFRLLVCGGREYCDTANLVLALDKIHAKHPEMLLIHGAAPGADSMAVIWAADHAVSLQPFPADWKQHGRAAGPIRNQQMIDKGKPDAVVSFPGGRGTADMMRRASSAGIMVWEPCKVVQR